MGSADRYRGRPERVELAPQARQCHLVGIGPLAPADVVRATTAVRANCLARGSSGVRTDVVQLLIDCLAHDILPLIPARGSVGVSGDLVPLCHLANMLAGRRPRWRYQ